MEDTKKTVLAGNGEKDVPRAVYDGVLTIDVDAQVESRLKAWRNRKRPDGISF